MTNRKTTLIQKDPSKGTAPNNNRPITCLLMMSKIITAQIREEIYYSLTSSGLFPDEQKGYCKGSKGTAELLYIDHIAHRPVQPKREQDQTEKSSYVLDWPQKGVWYSSAKLDNKLPQNVQNIRWRHKLYRVNHENLKSRVVSRDSSRRRRGKNDTLPPLN